ncbi:MAG: DUF5329 domain-containing protein [Desulfovibrio sp.]|jgi:hypothetical protein|nr:DUF5329 domain-containing protein [Desulfovibrio sp.]
MRGPTFSKLNCSSPEKSRPRQRGAWLLPAALSVWLLCAGPALAMPPGEEARVEGLLNSLAQQEDVTFIRNGREHSAAEAADHLRLKWNHLRERLNTAEQFIDTAGSRSSLSGQPYLMRKAGEDPRPAGPFLRELLRRAVP